MTTHQQHRRRAIRWAFFITGLIFSPSCSLAPLSAG